MGKGREGCVLCKGYLQISEVDPMSKINMGYLGSTGKGGALH